MPIYVFRRTRLHTLERLGLASGPRLALFLRRSPGIGCLQYTTVVRTPAQLNMPKPSGILDLRYFQPYLHSIRNFPPQSLVREEAST
jgi:hypothetical protein